MIPAGRQPSSGTFPLRPPAGPERRRGGHSVRLVGEGMSCSPVVMDDRCDAR